MPIHPCFVAGTKIATPSGDVGVEYIEAGQAVLTVVGEGVIPASVKWVGERLVELARDADPRDGAPIRIRRGALADGVPERDLLLSHDHRVFIDGKLIPARLLVNGMTIVPERGLASAHYFHIEMEQHSILIAEGLPAESYLDEANDRSFFSNAGVPVALQASFPVTTRPNVAALACAPLAMTAVASESAWRMIADRATALGFVPLALQTTTEPDLHLLADGNIVRPVVQDDTRCVFALPSGTRALRLGSRATVPFDLDRAHEDWRRLGVGVTKLIYRSGAEQIEIPADHPSLIRGWHDVETDGTSIWRWTNGDAHLPLPMPIDVGGITVEVHLSGRTTYAVTECAAEATRLIA